ncbi:MAG: S46 family peptidase, partial [Bacteroidota bacterium]
SGDFALFRIYAGKDGKPAQPSKDNVPWKPRRVMKVSVKGVDTGDFTMVFGFPGRTQSKLTSHAVEFIQNELNPMRIEMRTEVLDIYDKYMRADQSTFIKYASKQSVVANAWKKWIGQNRGLKRLHTLDQKQAFEQEFEQWVNEKSSRKEKYAQLLNDFEAYYKRANEIEMATNVFFETLWRIESLKFAYSLNKLAEQPDDLTDEDEKKLEAFARERGQVHFKNFVDDIDREVAVKMIAGYVEYMPTKYRIDYLVDRVDDKFGGSAEEYVDWLYKKSELDNFEDYGNLIAKKPKKIGKKISKDPVYELAKEAVDTWQTQILPARQALEADRQKIERLWFQALMEMNDDDRIFYPDANSTMRVSYGQSEDYDAYDAVTYQHFTTLEGVMEKQDTTVTEFTVDPKLIQLYENKDYGQYADEDGQLHVNFIASNHTSGGNSGSPVINAQGELIGLNFDRNWEGTMSDIVYDKSLVRNISVDIRYILFIIDKFGGADHLIKEMDLSRN